MCVCLKITAKNNQLVLRLLWLARNQSMFMFARSVFRFTSTSWGGRGGALPPSLPRNGHVREDKWRFVCDNPLNSLKYYAQIHLTFLNTHIRTESVVSPKTEKKSSLNRMSRLLYRIQDLCDPHKMQNGLTISLQKFDKETFAIFLFFSSSRMNRFANEFIDESNEKGGKNILTIDLCFASNFLKIYQWYMA